MTKKTETLNTVEDERRLYSNEVDDVIDILQDLKAEGWTCMWLHHDEYSISVMGMRPATDKEKAKWEAARRKEQEKKKAERAAKVESEKKELARLLAKYGRDNANG